MLIDRVAMKEVANHQSVNEPELRQQSIEKPAIPHCAQPVCRVFTSHNAPEMRPERSLRIRCTHQGNRFQQLSLGLNAESQRIRGHPLEDFQDLRHSGQCITRRKNHRTINDREDSRLIAPSPTLQSGPQRLTFLRDFFE